MIETPTLFVIGAGGSAAALYPTGEALTEKILVDLRRGEILHRKTLQAGFAEEQIEAFRSSLHDSSLNTIDSFLELMPDFRGIGTFAIAAELISNENEETLIALGRTSWYGKLRRVLGKGTEELHRSHVKFVTFNYDRSLEHFLFKAYSAVGVPNTEKLPHLMRNLGFIHMHGSLSPLPWWQKDASRPYAATSDTAMILASSKQIALAHESLSIDYAGLTISQLIEEAQTIYFLGFGFAPENMNKLGLGSFKGGPSNKSFGGTTLGLHPVRISELEHSMGMACFGNIDELFKHRFRA